MEEQDGRTQVIQAAARGLHEKISLSRELNGSGTRAGGSIHDKDISHAAGDQRVVYGLKRPCRNRRN
ncbi:MAG: hypothetical protein M3P29_13030, partial [Acidobacteriota bacterium]|nr:hypothetical protein [Acidobacteriota bacterium]